MSHSTQFKQHTLLEQVETYLKGVHNSPQFEEKIASLYQVEQREQGNVSIILPQRHIYDYGNHEKDQKLRAEAIQEIVKEKQTFLQSQPKTSALMIMPLQAFDRQLWAQCHGPSAPFLAGLLQGLSAEMRWVIEFKKQWEATPNAPASRIGKN